MNGEELYFLSNFWFGNVSDFGEINAHNWLYRLLQANDGTNVHVWRHRTDFPIRSLTTQFYATIVRFRNFTFLLIVSSLYFSSILPRADFHYAFSSLFRWQFSPQFTRLRLFCAREKNCASSINAVVGQIMQNYFSRTIIEKRSLLMLVSKVIVT